MTLKTLIRDELGLNRYNRCPIELVKGDCAPHFEGKRGHWTTPSGKTIVHYPNAYKYTKVYHRSTRKIVVGEQWVLRIKL